MWLKSVPKDKTWMDGKLFSMDEQRDWFLWGGIYSWWRGCGDYWNDDRGFRIAKHKLSRENRARLKRKDFSFWKEVLPWVKQYCRLQRNYSWKEEPINAAHFTAVLHWEIGTVTPAFSNHHPDQSKQPPTSRPDLYNHITGIVCRRLNWLLVSFSSSPFSWRYIYRLLQHEAIVHLKITE